MKRAVFVAGTGKIGALIAALLMESGDYDVHLGDIHFEGDDAKRLLSAFPNITTAVMDVSDEKALEQYFNSHQIKAVLTCLPFFCNIHVAQVCGKTGTHYFDLTEDVSVTRAVKEVSTDADCAFVPQCGLAPGFISIVANHLMQHFDEIDEVKMRVGALPQNSDHFLRYNLTWSTEGVINEYGNPCHAIEGGEDVILHPLEGLESITLDGLEYEAFNTSGGLGSLPELYAGKVRNMNYKTMRYPGHCEKMRFLMNDLKLNDDRDTLKRIFERAIPKTYQDVVVVYVSVKGYQQGLLVEENYLNKIYPRHVANFDATAIQITTASGILSVMELVLADESKYKGLIYQEKFSLDDFLANRFGQHYTQRDAISEQ